MVLPIPESIPPFCCVCGCVTGVCAGMGLVAVGAFLAGDGELGLPLELDPPREPLAIILL